MARIRSIHPGQWTDEDFFSCSMGARLAAIAIRNEADDNGIFPFKPLTLKARIFPADNLDMSALLNELIETNQIIVFECEEGKRFGIIKNFQKFQSPRKPTFYHPVPTGELPTGYQLHSDYKPKSSIPVPNQYGTGTGIEVEREKEKEREEEQESNANALLVASDADNPCRDEGILAEKPKAQILKPDKPKPKLVPPPCPYQQIVELYHEILPMCPRVKEMTSARKAHLRARWVGARERQNLEWWRRFFGYVAKSDFLTGNAPGYNGRKPFQANLSWLVKQENFTKIREGNYEDEQPRQYAS